MSQAGGMAGQSGDVKKIGEYGNGRANDEFETLRGRSPGATGALNTHAPSLTRHHNQGAVIAITHV
jgi:hypothetical protein